MMRDIFLKILNNISSLRDLDVYDILYSINILSLKGLSVHRKIKSDFIGKIV